MTSRPQLAEAETVLRRFFALPPRQQLEHYQVVHDYLLAADGIQGGIPPEIAERIEALAVMKKVADELARFAGGRVTAEHELQRGLQEARYQWLERAARLGRVPSQLPEGSR